HLSHQYNSLFSFTTLGFTANTEGYLINWFVYDTNAQNNTANQCRLNQRNIDIIEYTLATINPFVQGLYQLRNTDYLQAQLIIQQATADIEIAAYIIIYSTAVVQERSVQIWKINKKSLRPDHASINISVEQNNEPKIIDEINDYLNAHYLSTIEAAWRIFKYKIASQLPSVTCLLIHLPEEQII
ncbi:29381_t:CDS:2, partial [Gigaspora margarita]